MNDATLMMTDAGDGNAEQPGADIPGPGPWCVGKDGGILSYGSLMLTNSAVLGTRGPGVATGGGSAVLIGCTLSGNSGAGFAGSNAVLRDCILSGNSGPGISGSAVSVVHCTVSDNDGRGVETRDMEITRSTLSGNVGGVYVSPEGHLIMTDSTVSGNVAGSPHYGGEPGYGGGILCTSSDCSIVNSTLSGNFAGYCYYDNAGDGHMICGEGGAIYGSGTASILITNSTLVDNYSEWGGPVGWSAAASPPGLVNSIVADGCVGDVNDLGNNLGCGPGFAPITGLDTELADNGGPTLTHALLPGSSAIDAARGCGLATDQRGVIRPRDGNGDGIASCDVGAFELVPLQVEIDIKPDGYPNSINPRGHGVIPVALLGSEDFDVADVDVTTLRVGPDRASPAHDLTDSWNYNDHLQDVNLDGFVDLVSHYRTQETGIACGQVAATLAGKLLDSRPFEGADSIRTVGCRIRLPVNSRPERRQPPASFATDRPVEVSFERRD
jgi:hypothetical protein